MVAAVDDGCAMVVLAARVWLVLLVDVFASFLNLRPGVGDSSASSFEPDVLVSVDFASSFVDDVGEDSVLAAPGFGLPASLSSSPFEAPVVDEDDVDDDVFESEDFDSAAEDLAEPD